jgi:dnd system-associated protein 4
MARVRVPKTAEPLLTFMEKDLRPSPQACFPTYANMIVFAASVGFDANKFDRAPAFIKANPDPIDVEVFRNRGLFRFLQLLAIARDKDHEHASDEEHLAMVLEGYASAGFGIMKQWYDETGGSDPVFVQKLVGEIMQRSPATH